MITREDPGDPELLAILHREIDASGPMCFARFMDLALHHPRHGYYAAGESRIGPGGDFFTASDLGPAFGRCIARQIAEIARAVGPDRTPFDVIEFGAGRGLLARDVLDALGRDHPALAGRVRCTLVDLSPAMREAARARVPEARVLAPDELGTSPVGCVLAVELFDALPVHRLRRRQGRLLEVRVDREADGRLAEVEVDPCPDAAEWAARHGAARHEGSDAEVAPVSDPWLDRLVRAVDRGAWIVVDYGDRPERLYGPERPRGTLLAYHEHATHERYLERVGRQDLTAHVNFSALEDRARALGVDVLGLTSQDRFLIGNGLLGEFDQPDARTAHDPSAVKRRMQAMQLLHPLGMGRTFRVLVLGRGLDADTRLAGLVDPFA